MRFYYLIKLFGHSGSSARITKHACEPKLAARFPIDANKFDKNFITFLLFILYIKTVKQFDNLNNCYKVV